MNVRLIQQLSALCLMSVLLPCGAFASLYVDHFAAPQGGPARTDSALESILSGTNFLLIDKTTKMGDPQTAETFSYEFLSLFTDDLSSSATGSTRVTKYDSHDNNITDSQLPTLGLIVGRMHNDIDSRIIFTGKPTKTNETLGGGPSDLLQPENYVAISVASDAMAASPVPEPATFVLLTTGIIGLWLLKRKPKNVRI